jgi:hypothetical protein
MYRRTQRAIFFSSEGFIFLKNHCRKRRSAGVGGAKVGTSSGLAVLDFGAGLGAALKAACALRPAKVARLWTTLRCAFADGKLLLLSKISVMEAFAVSRTGHTIQVTFDVGSFKEEAVTRLLQRLYVEYLAERVAFGEDVEALGAQIKHDWWQQNKERILAKIHAADGHS